MKMTTKDLVFMALYAALFIVLDITVNTLGLLQMPDGGSLGVSVIPLLMLIFGQVRVRYPSVICVACSIISLAALAIFFGRSLLIEIKKRLHF